MIVIALSMQCRVDDGRQPDDRQVQPSKIERLPAVPKFVLQCLFGEKFGKDDDVPQR